jgi:site-specific DNA-methyltransferase (cytosine-N4-specific)
MKVVSERNRRTVWTIPTMPYAGAHFATMPEQLVEPCILAGSRFGDLVCDPFLGSGTVGAVAERLGRRWVGIDLNPLYHALAKARTAQRGLPFEREDAADPVIERHAG